jgi:hypothetical protein
MFILIYGVTKIYTFKFGITNFFIIFMYISNYANNKSNEQQYRSSDQEITS